MKNHNIRCIEIASEYNEKALFHMKNHNIRCIEIFCFSALFNNIF